jgi:hypothetical protein
LGFAGSNEDLFRFCNRFRLAKAFARIDAKGYNPTTLSAYSALLKVFLVFSAFELLLKALNMKHRGAVALCNSYQESSAKIAAIQRIPNSGPFFMFVTSLLDNRAKDLARELALFLRGNPISVYTLARSVRHIFSHGHLASSPSGVQPSQVVAICNVLNDFLLHVMDEEVKKRVAKS